MGKNCKEIGEFFKDILLLIFIIPFGILAIACLVIILPLDYIKYKKSPYYKKERQRYSLFAGVYENFKLYNEIEKYNLPIKYMKNPEDSSIQSGWFVFEKTLIIINYYSFEYDCEKKRWICDFLDDDDEENIMSLDEFIDLELLDFHKNVGQTLCEDAIVLMDEKNISNIDIARTEERFLLYNRNRVDSLRRFLRSKWSQERIAEALYDKQLECFNDEVIRVIYSKDKFKRYVILKTEDGILTYLLEEIYQFDDEEWNYVCNQESVIPAMWEPKYTQWHGSHFNRECELMNELIHEPEYKQFFS